MKIDDMTLEQAREALKKAREIAIREHVDSGRWCESGLNDALREMGVPAYREGGETIVTMTFKVQHEEDYDIDLWGLEDNVNRMFNYMAGEYFDDQPYAYVEDTVEVKR